MRGRRPVIDNRDDITRCVEQRPPSTPINIKDRDQLIEASASPAGDAIARAPEVFTLKVRDEGVGRRAGRLFAAGLAFTLADLAFLAFEGLAFLFAAVSCG